MCKVNEDITCIDPDGNIYETHEDWNIKNLINQIDLLEELNNDIWNNKEKIGEVIEAMKKSLNELLTF